MRYGMILPEATVYTVVFSIEYFRGKKSRKHQNAERIKRPAPIAVGYIRLSVANREKSNSSENQKFIIECWSKQSQIPISRYYIANGYSPKKRALPL